jgi:septum formation protein
LGNLNKIIYPRLGGLFLNAIGLIMITLYTLFLGSKSPSRQLLLKEALIPFALVSQDADETVCDWGLPLVQLVEHIALFKMQHVQLPAGKKENDFCFVLTADTLSQDTDGTINGKPADTADAIAKIKAARAGSRLCTAFCLDKKIWHAGQWEVDKRIQKAVSAEYVFNVPDVWIDIYLKNSLGLSASNAIAVEGFGAQFLQVVRGSYTTIVGLPMYELRQTLEEMGFHNIK